MKKNKSPAKLFAGIKNIALDKRKFNPSRDDIESLCSFFGLGKLKNFEKEKGIIISHSSFFVYAATTNGEYALKFYPPDRTKTIATEYALNRILLKSHFPTPAMFAGMGNKPFMASHNLLATCHAYIDGVPAWQQIKKQNTFHQINGAMFSLKNILSAAMRHIPPLKQKNLVRTINALVHASRLKAPYDQKKIIDASLLDAWRTYKLHQPLFTRQWLHSDANLNNFLIYKKTVYTLDLSHIREDYILSDLVSLVRSYLFFDAPVKTLKAVVKDYFTWHKIGPKLYPVLNTLVKVRLVREYLSSLRHKESRKSTVALLKKMNDNPTLIV